MIMSKTPFRISFVGGGSDIKDFYQKGYGAVVSTSIDKYMYIMIHPYFHNKIRIKYSKLEDVDEVDQIQHPIVRECLKLISIEKGVEIASVADVPAGTGVGSSSSFTVGLLHALYTYNGKSVNKEKLAQESCMIEIKKLQQPIGKQDQYATSYGGLNYIRFNPDETVSVEPIVCKPEIKKEFEENLIMFYVGNERDAIYILSEQKENMKQQEKHNNVKKMVELANDMRKSLINGEINKVGEIMHEGWLLKKTLASKITNPIIDEYYERAIKAGAIGGKLLGAGAGGFLLFNCRKEYQNSVRQSLGLRELKFKFDYEGSKIIYTDNSSY